MSTAASANWGVSTDEEEKRIINQVGGLQINEKPEGSTTPTTPPSEAPSSPVRAFGRGRGLLPRLPPTDGDGGLPVGGSTNGAPSPPAPAPSPAPSPAPPPATAPAASTSPAPSSSPPPTAQEGTEAGTAKSGGAGEGEEDISAAEKSLLTKILRNNLVSTKYDVEIQRQNPDSPLYSVKSFEQLPLRPELLRGVHAMGFLKPSKIQESTLPPLIADPPQNIIAQSQSGTGKTAAFVLAMLSRVDPLKDHPQVLCLSPTFELALQTGEVVQKMGQFCPDITMRYVVRGEEFRRGEKISEHIIIGTPGKVVDWALKYKVLDLRNVKVFVLDEADVMIAIQGHQDQSLRIQKTLPPKCQMLLFSATYDEDVMNFASKIIKDPIIMRLRRNEESLDNIKQYYIKCTSKEEKYHAITNIYGVITVGQAIVFTQTKAAAEWLAGQMSRDGHTVGMLTGDLQTDQRVCVLNRFREGKEKVLIATNVMARGIDIEQVTLVINYDLPVDKAGRPDCETYLHRIGRTGRFGKTGIAINLVDSDRSVSVLREIEQHFGRKIELLDAEDVDDIEKLNQ